MKKLDLRGGFRTPKNLELGTSRLLQCLIEQLGGATKVATELFLNPQIPVNWKLRGQVPLEHVGRFARKFKIPEEGLNYEQLIMLKGAGPTWSKVVASYGFPRDVVNYILKGKSPRELTALCKEYGFI